jgi:hypothetical protein
VMPGIGKERNWGRSPHGVGEHQCSVVVLSCDAYADLWPAFFALFDRFWEDCPFPVFLGSNTVDPKLPRVSVLKTGRDFGWSNSAATVFSQVRTKYVLLMLEDFFLREAVRTDRILDRLSDMERLRAAYVRLRPFPAPDRRVADAPELGRIDVGAPYRAALQAALWRTERLLGLLRPGETAWEMEALGSRRSDVSPSDFYSTWRPHLEYEAGVCMRKWLPHAVRQVEAAGIVVDTSKRPIMSRTEYAVWCRGVIANNVMNRIPWRLRRRVGDVLRAVGVLPRRRAGT